MKLLGKWLIVESNRPLAGGESMAIGAICDYQANGTMIVRLPSGIELKLRYRFEENESTMVIMYKSGYETNHCVIPLKGNDFRIKVSDSVGFYDIYKRLESDQFPQ